MTHKQFALIIALWAAVMFTVFCTPARAVEIGQVQTSGSPTCADAKKDRLAASIRLNKLKDEYVAETDTHLRLVIKQEAKAVVELDRVITVWMIENCRGA